MQEYVRHGADQEMKTLIIKIFRLVFKLKQYPDFSEKKDEKDPVSEYEESLRNVTLQLNLM